MKQPIAIGVENYKTIIENNYYYIDKTWMLKELADQKGTVNLFTRPRRFGKTLTLSMVRTFFFFFLNKGGEKIEGWGYLVGKRVFAAC